MGTQGRAGSRVDASFGTLTRVADPAEDDGRGEEHGVLFWVNKGGFPVNHFTWERMWRHVGTIIPDADKTIANIRGAGALPEVQVPKPPLNFPPNMPTEERLDLVQKYMNELQYNHTGTQFYEILKHRPITGLMDTAKEMVRESLPIKCLEAVILALFLTNGFPGVERFPLSFKSVFLESEHRHVVLGIYYGGHYGALGMSRREELMYKPMVFKSLSALIRSYQDAYKKYWHVLKKVKLGLPVPHDAHSYEQIVWRNTSLSVSALSSDELNREVEKAARAMRSRMHKIDKLQSVYNQGKIIKSGVAASSPAAFPWRHSLPLTTEPNGQRRESKSSKVHSKAKKVSDHGRRAKGGVGSSSHYHPKERSAKSRSSGSDKSKKGITTPGRSPSSSQLKSSCVLPSSDSITQTNKKTTQDYQIRI